MDIRKSYFLIIAVIAVFLLASCKAVKPPTIDSKFEQPKSSAGGGALNLDELNRQILANDTITVYLKIIMPVERQRLEAENSKLKRDVKTWEYIAAGMFLLATGSYLIGL